MTARHLSPIGLLTFSNLTHFSFFPKLHFLRCPLVTSSLVFLASNSSVLTTPWKRLGFLTMMSRTSSLPPTLQSFISYKLISHFSSNWYAQNRLFIIKNHRFKKNSSCNASSIKEIEKRKMCKNCRVFRMTYEVIFVWEKDRQKTDLGIHCAMAIDTSGLQGWKRPCHAVLNCSFLCIASSQERIP